MFGLKSKKFDMYDTNQQRRPTIIRPKKLSKKQKNNTKRILSKNLVLDEFDNVLLLGGARTLKDGCLIYPNINLGNSSYIITDIKREKEYMTKENLLNKGYSVSVLDLYQPEISISYDPLYYVSTEEDLHQISIAMADYMNWAAKSVSILDSSFECSFRRSVIFELVHYLYKKHYRFSKMAELLDELIENESRTLAYKDIFTKETLALVDGLFRNAIYVDIRKFFPSGMISVINKSDPFNFASFCDKKTSCFVNLSMVDPTHNLLQMIFLKQAAYSLQEKGSEHVTFILSDCPMLPLNWQEILSLRAHNASTIVSLQHLDGLDESTVEHLFMAIPSVALFGRHSDKDCYYFTKYLGLPKCSSSNFCDDIRRLPNSTCFIFKKGQLFIDDKAEPQFRQH